MYSPCEAGIQSDAIGLCWVPNAWPPAESQRFEMQSHSLSTEERKEASKTPHLYLNSYFYFLCYLSVSHVVHGSQFASCSRNFKLWGSFIGILEEKQVSWALTAMGGRHAPFGGRRIAAGGCPAWWSKLGHSTEDEETCKGADSPLNHLNH